MSINKERHVDWQRIAVIIGGGCAVCASILVEASSAQQARVTTQQSLVAAPAPPDNPLIDYNRFIEVSREVQDYRQQRRISIDKFLQMAKEPGTIILDARSQEAYKDIHLKGAKHLSFSDFTDEKLAEVIRGKGKRVLIYCNNNFKEHRVRTLQSKRPSMALNIPTFVNLYGYGYRNVYELADLLELHDERLRFGGDRATSAGILDSRTLTAALEQSEQ